MKSVYTGGEKVAEFKSYEELRVGDGKPAFIYEGDELVYPSPVKDGLVLWYDFSGRTNTDGQRGIAEDLSGNGNHGTLQNFNYTAESGYDKNKLLFDGVDDRIQKTIQGVDSGNFHISFVAEYAGKLNSAQYTIQINLTSGGRILLFKSGNGEVAYYSTENINSYSGFKPQINEKFSFSINLKDKKVSIGINGNMSLEKIDEGLTADIYNLDFSSSLARHYGSIYSAKLYNRPLTPEEIAHNYAIEKERFGIE